MKSPQPRTRGSTVFGFAVGGLGLVLVVFLVWAKARAPAVTAALERKRQVVVNLGLTDLSLFTEARYTRHLSQTDLTTPFQDHPVSLERFPSGMLVPSPERPAAAVPEGTP